MQLCGSCSKPVAVTFQKVRPGQYFRYLLFRNLVAPLDWGIYFLITLVFPAFMETSRRRRLEECLSRLKHGRSFAKHEETETVGHDCYQEKLFFDDILPRIFIRFKNTLHIMPYWNLEMEFHARYRRT